MPKKSNFAVPKKTIKQYIMKALNKRTAPKSVAPEKIIQFGEGNFLRAFIDWIVYNMNQKTDFNGSVVVVQPIEHGMVDMLNGQDCLYHVNLQGLEEGKPVNSLTRIDCISRALNPYTQNQAFMALAEQPEIRFVISNTTEAGIAFDSSCKLEDAPASSYPGKLTQLLYRRYQTFHGAKDKGLIIFPCELIFLNGHHLKDCIYQYIELWNLGEDFKQWFTECCGVYATLVDRIVPGFPRKDIKQLQERACYADNMVVQAEIFHLWVIEAPQEIATEFPADKAGLHVLFVPSEAPYHERKVTLLNGPHTVLSPVAFLSGVNIVRDACKHPVIGKYIEKVQYGELMETLNLPKDELKKFAADVVERFMNPFVDHQVTSIMLNSFPKYQTRDLPGVKVYLERKGELPQGLVFGLAAIITYYKGGKRSDGVDVVPNDAPEIMKLLTDLWATGDIQKVTDGVLGATSIWGEDLNAIKGLNALVKRDLELIQSKGMLEAVKTIL
jgi:tagaturonate reductase